VTRPSDPVRILVAEDDPDDQLLLRDALAEARLANQVDFVADGVELMDYLRRKNRFASLAGSPLPGVLLLDLNMPRKDGRAALAEIKQDPVLKRFPVIVFTTSQAEEDLVRSYELGVNSFIVKPVRFETLIRAINTITDYWFQIVRLPPIPESAP